MKIKVLTGYDGVCSHRELTLANFTEYCERWGYELITKFNNWGPREALEGERTPGKAALHWRRYQLIAQELHSCDWVVWLDADCMIVNMTIPLTGFVDDTIDLAITGPFHPCESCGAPIYSAGVLLLRCCDWSRAMVLGCLESIKREWRQGPTSNCTSLAENNWLCCKFLPANMKHVKVIPPETAGYYTLVAPGQFLIHLYGAPDEGRTKTMLGYAAAVIR